jgi:copper chaperone CopZ
LSGENLSTTNKEKQVSVKGKADAEKNRVLVSVTRIDCAICGRAIEKQVKKVKGVKDVKTAIMLNKVFIDYDPKLVNSTTIRKAIDKTGYKGFMTVEEK